MTTISNHESVRLNEMSKALTPNIEALVNTEVEKYLEIFRRDIVNKLQSIETYVENCVSDICKELETGKTRISNHVTNVKERIETIQTKQNEILRNDQSFEKVCLMFTIIIAT